MPRYSYDRLTFLDNSFLVLEKAHTPMHIAGTATFDAEPLKNGDGIVDINRIRAYIESRLHLVPRYRQRLHQSWLLWTPIWVDYEHFNIHYHVRHTALPKPGDERQLKRLAGRIMAQHLDRSKPLWEIWIVEGLDDGRRVAMISKVHHCLADGISSVDLLNVLLTAQPLETFAAAEKFVPRPAPSEYDLLMEEVGSAARLPFQVGRTVTGLISQAQDPLSDIRARFRSLREMVGGTFLKSNTPLNQSVGPHRRLDWLAMDIGEIKAVKNALGGTVNDVVLATVAGALRGFLQQRDVSCDELDFRVMAPVSVRSDDERGGLGNRVSAWIVPMPLGEPDAQKRFEQIRATTSHLKEAKQALGAEMLTQVGEWTPSTILSIASRMATRALPFNLVVTNVPGPQVPLYLLGSRMQNNFGFLPLIDGLCMGIVLFSYAGSLCWGFTCDWDLLPDLHDFVLDIEASFQQLKDAAAAAAAGTVAPPQPAAEEPEKRKSRARKIPVTIAPESETRH